MVTKTLHFGTAIISRNKSRPDNAVAACAYRSGQDLHDEKLDKTHHYSNRKGVIEAQIFAPENAPEWMHTNNWSQFGNAIEKAEDGHNRRNSALLAKDFQMAAPRELSREENWELAQTFAHKINQRGLSVAVAFHEEKASDGGDNPHFHFLVPMREVHAEGFGKRYRKFDGVKAGQDTEIMKLRREYYLCVNDALEKAGVNDVRYDPEKQEGTKPKAHKGKQANALEKQGVKTRVGEHNRRVDIDNLMTERYSTVKQDWEQQQGNRNSPKNWESVEKYRTRYQLNRGSAIAARDAHQKTQSNVAAPAVNRSENATARAREQAILAARQPTSFQERIKARDTQGRDLSR